jgi:hypothetical protein
VIRKEHLSRVLQPGAEIRDDAAAEVTSKASVAQRSPGRPLTGFAGQA